MNPDGSDVIQVTDSNSARSHLQWLPDGRSVLFISGTCVFSVDFVTDQIETLICFKQRSKFFEGFRISLDGTKVAISLNRELFVVPFDKEVLKKVETKSDLMAMENSCFYNLAAAQDIRWSNDGKQLAITYLDTASRLNERIRLLEISSCPGVNIVPLTDFPPMDYLPEGFQYRPEIPDFDWNGDKLFLFNDFIRNEGFGNLYLFDNSTQEMSQINPIDGVCCYRDARWSPDANYVLFLLSVNRV